MNLDFLKLDLIYSHFNFHLLKNKTILLTGGTGFFGKWFCLVLNQANKDFSLNLKIFIITRNKKKFINEFDFLDKTAFQFIESSLEEFIPENKRYDFILHLATSPVDEIYTKSPFDALEQIVQGTKNLLNQASISKPENFLYISSGAVYGEMRIENLFFEENDAIYLNDLNPKSIYGHGKRISEIYTETFAKQNNLNYSIARCFAFTGPYLPLDSNYVIGNFIKNVIENQDLIIKGDGKTIRSYLYMSDLIICLLKILMSKKNEIYNVGSDEEITVFDLAKKVKEVTKSNNEIVLKNQNVQKKIDRYVPNINKLKNEFDFKIYTNLEESIELSYKFNLGEKK